MSDMSSIDMNDPETSCGFVSLLGAPNAGKSTLINALVGQHVSIVSAKVQTTRFPVRGVALHGKAQMVLIDTPGLFRPKGEKFAHAMVQSAMNTHDDTDLTLMIVDAARASKKKSLGLPDQMDDIANQQGNKNIWLVLNKIDDVNKEKLLKLTMGLNERYDFQKTFMISALKKSGVSDLKNALAEAMPKSHWFFPEDQVMDMPLKLYAAERTREAAFNRLHQELPYGLAVHTETLEQKDNGIEIHQVIYIKEDRHKGMVLGKAGSTIKAIGTSARLAMEEDLEQKINLQLFVKNKSNWDQDPDLLSFWGLSE